MFEHSTLQEAYTGALIAGKGKTLNNINLVMDRARFKTEEWVRVRFGAGVPWRRCWCVISPPDEKEYQKLLKEMRKKSPYDHSRPPLLKGDIKFYDTKKDGKKQKKAKPIASITDAYSCYAIYPQAKSLIDASTLIKIEGNITIHSEPPSSTEGFIFIMPEVPPAVTGFEMLLRFLFPTWDTFGLYGRPGRLVASVLDPRSLMFAMPKHRRYGYLEILDVTSLILSEGSGAWSERDWKKKLKELTGQRMNAMEDVPVTQGRSASRRSKRLSIGPPANGSRGRVGFAEEGPSVRTSRSFSLGTPGPRNDSAPPGDRVRPPNALADGKGHQRNSSDTPMRPNGLDGFAPHLNGQRQPGGTPPRGGTPVRFANDLASTPERQSSEDDSGSTPPVQDLEQMTKLSSPEPVQAPPAFSHARTARPERAYHSPELRRATSRLSNATLQQLGYALKSGIDPATMEGNAERQSEESSSSASGHLDPRSPAVLMNANANPVGMSANLNGSREGLTVHYNNTPPRSPGLPPPQMSLEQKRSHSPLNQTMGASGGPQDAQRRPAPGPGQYPPGTQGGRGQYPSGGPGPQGGRGPPVPPHGGPGGARGPPPGYGRGRGMPPPPIPQSDDRRPSPGPRGAPNQFQVYQNGGNSGPPPHTRKTPPPGAQRKPVPSPHGQMSPPIHRKPLPQRNDSLQSHSSSSRNDSLRSRGDGATPLSPTTPGSFRDPILDEAAFQLVNSPERSLNYEHSVHSARNRQNTMRSEASSNYDDAASTASPDYASTRKSSETQESVERPRAGVLKTVGDPVLTPQSSRANMPDINFGPTLNLADPRNAARGGGPWVPPNPPATQPQRPYSPSGARKPTLTTTSANITPSTGEIGHYRSESEDTIKRRSVAWQPGAAIGGGIGQAVSPEEFVQQRAAAAITSPQYAHQRTPSGNVLSSPLKRTGSQDYLNNRHSRSGSAELLQRRNSQDTSFMLGSGAASSHLSAREQEHVARATGTPLIGMATNNNPGPQSAGLVGAIQARELEKAQMRQGMNSQSVQNAINQRQQQQQYAQQQQQFAQQQMYGAASNMSMGNVGMAMSPPPPSAYGGSNMGMQPVGGMQPMGRGGGGYTAAPGPPRAHTLSPPPVGLPGNMAPMSPMGPTRAQSPGPRFMSPPPMQGMQGMGGMQGPGQYKPQTPSFGQQMQMPMRMQSPGPGGPMRVASPGPAQGPMRMASPGPGQGPMRMNSPGPGQMRMASPGPNAGMAPMRLNSPGPGAGPMRSPGPQQFSRQMTLPPAGQYGPLTPGTPSMAGMAGMSGMPGTPGTPRGPMPPYHGQAF